MSQELYLNGIDATTGGPLDGDFVITTEMIAKVARGEKLTPEDLRDAKIRKTQDQSQVDNFGVGEGIDNSDLAQTGWSVIFPASLPQKSVDALKEALKPLLDLRQAQAGATTASFYKEVIGPELGYKNGESKNDFLKRFGRGPGPADPEKFPYYALIVGSPETIPFSFQYQLDVQYAVGRIYFDRLEDYYQYATSVVAAEQKKLVRAKKAAFFGPSNPDDGATKMSSSGLLAPLSKQMKAQYADWTVDLVDPLQATKANLASYLGGAQTPSLLFTASHGMKFPLNDPRQLSQTGAILCQDWPGMKARVPVTDQYYFSAEDLSADADVFGMIAFIFACYGGGMPKSDDFYRQAFGEQKDIAPYAFLSQLPLKLLSHPKGGALGVFAHVERAWGQSIQWDGVQDDIGTFDSTVEALLNGKPAGAATEYFNERYAEISTELTEEIDNTTPEVQDETKMAGLWTSNNDARNYTFIGDPAVRLPVGDQETTPAARASLGSLVSTTPITITSAATGFQPDVVDRTPAVQAASSAPAKNFGISDVFKKDAIPAVSGTAPAASGSTSEALRKFVDQLGNYLSRALDEATSFEVSTFVAADMQNVRYEAGKFEGAELRAVTRINLVGDTLVCIPEKDGQADTAVWAIHAEMVKAAQENRAELLKTLVSAAASLTKLG